MEQIQCLPEYLIIASDSKGRGYRHDIYSDYKANRSSAPDDLIPQFDILEELYEAFNLKCLKFDAYEADDIIFTTTNRLLAETDLDVVIFSSDKDLMQLIGERVKFFSPMKREFLDSDYIVKKIRCKTRVNSRFFSIKQGIFLIIYLGFLVLVLKLQVNY